MFEKGFLRKLILFLALGDEGEEGRMIQKRA